MSGDISLVRSVMAHTLCGPSKRIKWVYTKHHGKALKDILVRKKGDQHDRSC